MTENTGYEAYRLYSALKLHFTSDSYNFFKYNGKTNVSKQSFTHNKSKYQFYKLARKYNIEELKDFYVANFLAGKGDWVGELLQDGEQNYNQWQKRIQSLTYTFENDVQYLLELVDGAEFSTMDDYFKPIGGGWPSLITKLMQNKISLETACILIDIVGCMPRWEKQITEDIVWPTWHRLIKRYTPFIQYDKEKFLHILKRKIRETA